MPDLLARIWADTPEPISSCGPLNTINNRKPSSLDFDESPHSTPRSMSSLFTPPAPIGWHLKKSNSPEKVNTYRAFANNSPPTMPFQGEPNNDLGVDQTTPQDYLSRYQHLKNIEGYKNELIEVRSPATLSILHVADFNSRTCSVVVVSSLSRSKKHRSSEKMISSISK